MLKRVKGIETSFRDFHAVGWPRIWPNQKFRDRLHYPGTHGHLNPPVLRKARASQYCETLHVDLETTLLKNPRNPDISLAIKGKYLHVMRCAHEKKVTKVTCFRSIKCAVSD